MKKNGFISTTLIYTFFIIFLLLMILVLNSYSSKRFLLEKYIFDIRSSFIEKAGADIDLYIMVFDISSQEYEIKKDVPLFGYKFNSTLSFCKNNSNISFENDKVIVKAKKKDICYAYFDEMNQDINIRMYTRETSSGERQLVKTMPNYSYIYEKGTCSNGATIEFNESTRKFNIQSSGKTECEVDFIKKELDVIINIYKESSAGDIEYNDKKYIETKTIPGSSYNFIGFTCKNDIGTLIKTENNELVIESSGKNECNIYYDGGTDLVELIYMKESDVGDVGYTTGKKYSRTYSIPSNGYKYVGYLCDKSGTNITYNNGTFTSESQKQNTCRVYFNKYSGNVFLNYYLEKSDGTYESVSTIPSIGYVYNKEKSFCENNSKIIVDQNIVQIESTKNDTCNVYFDMINSDIKINVYVMNKSTGKYEHNSIPTFGYEMNNAGCTNGASIDYINGNLRVSSEGPTVCTVYFR